MARSFLSRSLSSFTVGIVLACCAPPADAEWVVAGYRGDGWTSSNTIELTPYGGSSGQKLTIAGIDYEGHGWSAPRYYGYRIARFLNGHPRFGIEIEFTHAKAYSNPDQIVTINGTRAPLGQVLPEYELTHGLNLAFANAVIRQPLGESGAARRFAIVGRAGGGVSIPHVQTSFQEAVTDRYQFGGPAWQIAGGAEIRIAKGLFALVDMRLSGAHVGADIGPASLSGTFLTRHFDVGAGWRFGGLR
jgi:hypothetical protein